MPNESLTATRPPRDPREPRVLTTATAEPPDPPRHLFPRDAEAPSLRHPIDLYRVTPASLAYAKQEAARERAEVDAVLRDTRRANAKELLRDLVARLGSLDVRTLLDEIESER